MSIHFGGRGPGHIARVQGSGPVLNLDLTSALDSRITASGGANGTRVNSSGLIVAATTPRFDYDPVTLAAKGVLIEEARTNVVTYSADISNAAWANSNSSDTGNTTVAPDGTTTAGTLTEGGGSAGKMISTNTFTSTAAAWTYSQYYKAGTRRYIGFGLKCFSTAGYAVAVVDTQTNTITQTTAGGSLSSASSSITDAGGGWYRVTVTGTFSGALGSCLGEVGFHSSGTPTLDSNGRETISSTTGTVILWGAQIEIGAFATSYIPTAGSTVTRTADSLTMTSTDFSSWFNASEGTFYFQGDSPGSGTRPMLSADDNTANEKFNLYTSTLDPKFLITDGGVSQADIDGGAITANTAFKFAAAFKANDCSVSLNGGAEVNDTSATMPTVDRLRIGADQAGNYLNGHAKAVKFYATNTDTQALTA